MVVSLILFKLIQLGLDDEIHKYNQGRLRAD